MKVRFMDGLLMALADSVPGVSGGTIAFLLGFYDRFISALRHVVSKNVEKRKYAWSFLLILGLGWCVGMVLAMLFLDNLVETQIYPVSSVFLGFVFASIPVVAWKERRCLLAHWRAWPMSAAGFILVFLITKLSISSAVELNLSRMTLTNGITLFVAAAAAASAMVLPGISGSSLLMAFGLYLPVVSRTSALIHGEIAALPVIMVFSLGAAAGLFSFVRLLNRALLHFRAQTMFAVIGMMIASLYAVAVGPSTLKLPHEALSLSNWRPEFFVTGCLIIACFAALEKILSEKKNVSRLEE
jgi:putative membrane protein